MEPKRSSSPRRTPPPPSPPAHGDNGINENDNANEDSDDDMICVVDVAPIDEAQAVDVTMTADSRCSEPPCSCTTRKRRQRQLRGPLAPPVLEI